MSDYLYNRLVAVLSNKYKKKPKEVERKLPLGVESSQS